MTTNTTIVNTKEKRNRIIEGISYLDNSPISIEIINGKISNISKIDKLTNPKLKNTFVAPGLIDHQVNGCLSYSFVDKDLTLEQIKIITKEFWKNGITSFLPTLTTNDFDLIYNNLSILKNATQDNEIGISIPGFHLEGPYISSLDGYRGAHCKKWTKNPDREEFSQWLQSSGNKILEVTIAPELNNAIEFIENCIKNNIVVALGHHNGSAEIVKLAANAGATVSTHLGNGCANHIHRHNNPFWSQLADDRLMASLIIDGFHLLPEEVQVFYKVKGPENTILVSDMSRLAGLPPGEYEDFGTKVIMTDLGKIIMPTQNVLAAASFHITKGIENMIAYTQCSLSEAINMASKNPAKLLNLNDRGELLPGKRADIILFTMNDNTINIKKTIVGGNVVYSTLDDW